MRRRRVPAGVGSVSLGLATAAAAGLGVPQWVWMAMLAIAVILGALALVEQVLEPRRKEVEHAAQVEQQRVVSEALEHLEYRHLTGSLTVAQLFDVFDQDPTVEGLQKAQSIVAGWAVDVADTIAVAAPHRSFFFSNDQGGPLPSYRGLNREQAAIIGILERQLARLANIIEEARSENRS
jgi:hypothetical protein